MKSNLSCDIMFCAIILILSVVNFSSAGDTDMEQVKNRRGGGGTVGLFAFPRVGRSNPSSMTGSNNWNNMIPVSYEEYEDDPRLVEMKRANLIPFPRVGRSDQNELRKWSKLAALQEMEKRTGSGLSANSGLWFGPRLGRIQKRSSNYPKSDQF